MEEKIVAVDLQDQEVYRISKEAAHAKPILHRAFSVFLHDSGYVLLQKRARGKYHSELLIANSCCSHPRTSADINTEAIKRVKQELGADINTIKEIGSFVYYNKFNENLYEYEYDHVLVGEVNKDTLTFDLDTTEVDCVSWVKIKDIKKDVLDNPQKYAAWFIPAFKIFLNYSEHKD